MRRPGHATIVAYLALFIALGGSSFAAVKLTRNSVRSENIKNGQVKAADIAKGAVTGAQVKNGSLTTVDFGRGQLAAGVKGDAGPRGEKGDPGLPGATGGQGPPGPVDGYTKTESDARFLPLEPSQVFRVASAWVNSGAGVTTSMTAGKTIFQRPTAGSISAELRLSLPVSLSGHRLRPTSARVCFLQSAGASTIQAVGIAFGSGDSAADDAASLTINETAPSGCLSIDITAALVTAGHPNGLQPDLGLNLVILASTTGTNRFLQLGAADVTLTPDP